MFRTRSDPAAFALAAALLMGCQKSPPTSPLAGTRATASSERLASVDLPVLPSDPSGFITGLTNPYLAFTAGRTFTYQSETETNVVEVLGKTKTILGVATTVVHDRVFSDGELTEDTYDWYAEDQNGNVWYFGEDSRTIEGGQVVSTEGSWIAGVDGATPGIAMLAHPKVGVSYQQEFAEGVAEDQAKVLSLKETVAVSYGEFSGCLQTQEWTHLEPGRREVKYYAPGVGLVLETAPGGERVELVSLP